MKESRRKTSSDLTYPLLFHIHHLQHAEDIPFWLELARGSPGWILELGCGSGRVTSKLASAGYNILGMDKDLSMLSFLRQNLPESLASRVRLMQADFTHFNLATKFWLQIMPCNTLSTLLPADRMLTLIQIHHHLLPGGVFAASMPNPTLTNNLPPKGESEVETILTHPTSKDPIQVSSAWERSPNHLMIFWHYDHLYPNGTVKRSTIQVSHSVEPAEKYRQDFVNAGLTITQELGDYNHAPFQEDSPYWIVLASKG